MAMQKPEWPGIATAVGTVLILTLIVVGSRDDFHLKDWQPLMAAIVALAGGALAYGAAMAKVNLDAEQNRRAVLRKQISLFLKLQITTLELRDVSLLILLSAPAPGDHKEMQVSDIDIKIPSDLAEVWENLDVFPVPFIRELAIIRESLHHISTDLRKVHTHASHMLAAKVHPKVVQERLGHSSIAITMDIYSHLMPNMQGEAAAAVDVALRAAINKCADDAS